MKDKLLDAYKKMLLIRIAEEGIADFYLKNKVMSFVHFYVGQEAIAVGVTDALGQNDKVLGNHRSHGHYLAKGGNLDKMISELLGKENGLAHGKGGSMHMIDKSVNFIGSTPILGSVAPLTCGTAFEFKFSKKDGIAVGFIGDGASEEGIVYETYNLAALFKLPMLIVIENNLFSVNSKISDRRSMNYDIEKIATGFGINYFRANGNDYEDVFEKATKSIEGVRQGKPAVLECVAYRHMAHSAPIFDENYREEDILEKRLQEDPITKLKKKLLFEGKTEDELKKIEEEIRQQVESSLKQANEADYPKKEELFTNVYAE